MQGGWVRPRPAGVALAAVRGKRISRRRAMRRAVLPVLGLAGLALALFWLSAGWKARSAPVAAPGFTLPEASGLQISLSDYRGRPLVLVFFRSFSSPVCRRHLSELQRAYQRIRAAGGEVVAISVEPREKSRAAKEELGLTFPILADELHAAAESYRVYDLLGDHLAAPAVFVMDKAGRIVWRYVGRDVTDWPRLSTVLAHLGEAGG